MCATVLYGTADINIAGKFDSNIQVAGFGETFHYKVSVFEDNPRSLVARNFSSALTLCSAWELSALCDCKQILQNILPHSKQYEQSEAVLPQFPHSVGVLQASLMSSRSSRRLYVWWFYRLDIRILCHQHDEQTSCSDIVNRMRGNTAEFCASEETRSRLSKILGSPGLAEVFPS